MNVDIYIQVYRRITARVITKTKATMEKVTETETKIRVVAVPVKRRKCVEKLSLQLTERLPARERRSSTTLLLPCHNTSGSDRQDLQAAR